MSLLNAFIPQKVLTKYLILLKIGYYGTLVGKICNVSRKEY